MNEKNVPIPSLLAVGAVHHHLTREGTRMKCGLVLESGEPREVMHFCLLLGYGYTLGDQGFPVPYTPGQWLTRSQLDAWTDRAKALGAGGLVWMRVRGDGADGTVAGLGEADLAAMLTDVWATLDLPGGPACTATLDPAVAPRISAQANLHGDAENLGHELRLVVSIDRDAAGLLAGAFFGTDGVSSVSEVQDAVGELANMCAGAVKTLLEGEWVIGIPTPGDETLVEALRAGIKAGLFPALAKFASLGEDVKIARATAKALQIGVQHGRKLT